MINYYVLDMIEEDELGTFWGYLSGEMFEVFPLSADDTKSELKKSGFIKCDAPLQTLK